MAQVAVGEEFGDILIGGPVHRNAKVIAIGRLEIFLVLGIVEPVIAEPVKVRELLAGKLIQLAIGGGGELRADEIVDVQTGVRDRSPLARHPVGQVANLLIAPVGADQVRVVDIGVIDILARLHLGLQLLDNIAFADQVVGHLDAGDRGEGRGQHLAFIFMRGDGFGHDLDLHPRKGLGRVDEPLHLGFLFGACQAGHVPDLGIQKRGCRVHVRKGRARQDQQRRRG